MIAMIFAAGVGSRLKPFTDEHPKALVEVGGTPMLGRVITKLRDAGVSKIVVNVHHFAGQIRDYLEANDFGLPISVSDESDRLLDTGGGILAASGLLGSHEPILVHNADILTDFPVDEMVAEWERARPLALLLTSERKTSRYLLFDSEKLMRGWLNVKTGETRPETVSADAPGLQRLAFGGVHIIAPEALESLGQFAARFGQGRPIFSIIDFYIAACGTHDIKAYIPSTPYRWFDVGKPETLEAARQAFK